jgi:hypothetical protein
VLFDFVPLIDLLFAFFENIFQDWTVLEPKYGVRCSDYHVGQLRLVAREDGATPYFRLGWGNEQVMLKHNR